MTESDKENPADIRSPERLAQRGGDNLQAELIRQRKNAWRLNQEGRLEEAHEAWSALAREHPNDMWVRLNLAKGYIRKGEIAQANIALSSFVVEKTNFNSPVLMDLASMALQAGETTLARRAAVLAAEKLDAQTDNAARQWLIRILILLGETESALSLDQTRPSDIALENDLAVIVDPGLSVTAGHHINYTVFAWKFLEKLRDAGASINPLVLCRELDKKAVELSNLRTLPALSFEPYAYRKFPNVWNHLAELNRFFEADLTRAGIERSVKLVFFHSMRGLMVDGFARWLDRVFEDRRGVAVIGLIEVDHMLHTPDVAESYSTIYRAALTRLVANRNIRAIVYVETAQGRQFLEGLGVAGLQVHVYPYLAASLCADYGDRREWEDSDSICIGMIGDTRTERGSHLIPQLVEITRDFGDQLHWKFQCDRQKLRQILNDDAAFSSAERALTGKNVTAFEGRLEVTNYFKLLDELDVVLLPYQKRYSVSGSGVFYEAMYMGKFLIVPRDSFMPEELEKIGHPYRMFQEPTVDSIFRELMWVVVNRRQIKETLQKSKNAPKKYPSDEFYNLVKHELSAI